MPKFIAICGEMYNVEQIRSIRATGYILTLKYIDGTIETINVKDWDGEFSMKKELEKIEKFLILV